MSTNDHNDPDLMTVNEVADALRVSSKTVRRRIQSGELGAVRLGRKGASLRVSRADLDAFVFGEEAER